MDVDGGLTRYLEVMGPPSSMQLRNSSMLASDSFSKSSSKHKNLGLENSFSTSSHKCKHSGLVNLVAQSSESFTTISNSSITLQKRGSWAPSGTIALYKIGDNLEGLNNILATRDSNSHSHMPNLLVRPSPSFVSMRKSSVMRKW